jgi:hypothetical protein
MEERFPLWLPRWKRLLYACIGVLPRDAYISLDGPWLRARFGPWLAADVPVAEIERVKHFGEQRIYSRLLFGFAAQRRRVVEVRFGRRLPVRVALWTLPYEGLILSLREPEKFEQRFSGLGKRSHW